MTKSKRLVLTIILILIPVIIFAEDHENMQSKKGFLDFLLSIKYLAVFIVAAVGITAIWMNKLSFKVRLILMSVSFLMFGVITIFAPWLFITPSPVCASTKPFLYGLRPQFLATLSVIGVMSLVVGKGFCGTVCPVGALQELLYRIPLFMKLKQIKVPFKITNTVRIALFILFLIVAFAFATSTYFYYNLFDLIHWEFEMQWIEFIQFMIFLVIVLSVSLFSYRPFCYFICPMGLYTWVLEHTAPLKVRVNKDVCNSCGACEKASPCNAVTGIVEGNKLRADCHLCGDCIKSCSQSALYFGLKK
ncbi:MAG: 4Fe-4S binding protein [Candidatus Kapaibacterium sp.]